MGVIEGWEFPWMKPVLSTGGISEAALVREQGGWVLAGSIGSAVLGFVFWGLAARLFSANAVGIAGSIVGLSSLATSIGILGLDNGLVRYAPRASRPRALMWRILLVGGGLASVVGLVLSLVVLTVSNDMAVLQILPALVVIAGTFGRAIDAFYPDSPYAPYFANWMDNSTTGEGKGFVSFDVDQGRIALRTTFVNATQPFTDSFTIRRPSNASPLVGTTGFLPWIVLAAIGGGAAIVGFQLKIRARPKPANGRIVPPRRLPRGK